MTFSLIHPSLPSFPPPTPLHQEEAFSIWQEWASYYPPDSDERALLDGVRRDRWLVSLVHHNYMDSAALWTFLLSENGTSAPEAV